MNELKVLMVAVVCLFSSSSVLADPAASYVVHASEGELVSNARPCGREAQLELQEIVSHSPVITVTGDSMSLRVLRVTRKADETYATDPMLGVFRTDTKTIVVALYVSRDRPAVEISLIRRSSSGGCYEKWVGLVESN